MTASAAAGIAERMIARIVLSALAIARIVLSALAFAAVMAAPCTAQTAGWHSYSDARHSFSFSYPDGWTLDANYQDKGYGYHQGDLDDVRNGVALRPAGNLAPGTDLQSDQLVLAVEAARPADRCEARAFLVDPPPDYFTETPLDKPDAVRTVAQAGDLYTIEHIVLIAVKTPCIAAHYTLVYHQPYAGGPPPFDRARVIGLLNAIAATIRPLK